MAPNSSPPRDHTEINAEALTELRRGSTFGRTLPHTLRTLLEILVTAPAPVPQQILLAGERRFAPFRRTRILRRIDRLITLRFAHRDDDGRISPTLTGLGAARPHAVHSIVRPDLRR